ncbi:MAG: SCO family protein [Turneriella sp.]
MSAHFVFFRRTLLLAGLLPGILLPACSERATFREMPLGLQPETELTAQNGQREKLVSHLKQVNLLFFGYTRCPDFCPMTLHRLHSALGDNTEFKAKLTLLFISVDPKNDTPAELTRYLAAFPYAQGFTGSSEEIRRVEKLFGAYSKPENASISHSLYLYVLNRKGRVIHLLRYDDPVEKLRLVLEQAAKGEQ